MLTPALSNLLCLYSNRGCRRHIVQNRYFTEIGMCNFVCPQGQFHNFKKGLPYLHVRNFSQKCCSKTAYLHIRYLQKSATSSSQLFKEATAYLQSQFFWNQQLIKKMLLCNRISALLQLIAEVQTKKVLEYLKKIGLQHFRYPI